MRRCSMHGGRLAVAALALALAPGCTYLRSRGTDAKQMFDLGFTFSKKPQFGLYANCPMVTPLGYSKVDGTFVGIGGGKLGAGEHHQNNSGLLLWGSEENSWKGSAKDDTATVEKHKAGVVGIAQGARDGKLSYRPACLHYLHLGFVGVMWNLNYYKMADFFCGWFGWVPFGDRNQAVDVRLAKADAERRASPPPTAPKAPVLAAAAPAPAGPPPTSAGPLPTSPGPLPLGEGRVRATEASAAPSHAPLAPALSRGEREREREGKKEEAAAFVGPPAPPSEAALALARDIAAKKAELAAAAAPPKPKFTIEQLVP